MAAIETRKPSLMYVRVPNELQDRLLREIRRRRVRSYALYFPLPLFIFTVIAAGLVFIRGHLELDVIKRMLSPMVPERVFTVLPWAIVIVGAPSALLFLLWQMYRECTIEIHFFCDECKAVDSDEAGVCPVCERQLLEQSGFFYTNYDDEKKLLIRRGFKEYRKE